jgi:hypothetical protein
MKDETESVPARTEHQQLGRKLPPEILDLIADHLRDESSRLRSKRAASSPNCGFIGRESISTRIGFYAWKSHIELRKKTLLGPSNSPVHHTRSLSIRDIPLIITISALWTWLVHILSARKHTRNHPQLA